MVVGRYPAAVPLCLVDRANPALLAYALHLPPSAVPLGAHSAQLKFRLQRLHVRRKHPVGIAVVVSHSTLTRLYVRTVRPGGRPVSGLVRGLAGVEDRPSDLGPPLRFLAGFVRADGVVLADRPLDCEGVIGDVGGE